MHPLNPITAAHLHLALGHVPILAILFGAAWLAFGLWRGSRDVQQAALGMLILAGLLAGPLYWVGEDAVGVVKGLPGFSDRLLEQHQAAAGITLAGCLMLGSLAFVGLCIFRKRAPQTWFNVLLLAGALVVGSLVLWTASLGGQIRHSEIRAADLPVD